MLDDEGNVIDIKLIRKSLSESFALPICENMNDDDFSIFKIFKCLTQGTCQNSLIKNGTVKEMLGSI